MPNRPTKDSEAVNIELPSDLMRRVRDFARRDERTLKAIFIRALRQFLETHDRPSEMIAGGGQPTAAASDTLPSSGELLANRRSPVEKLDEAEFAEFLKSLNEAEAKVALLLRLGASAELVAQRLQLASVADALITMRSLEKKVSRSRK